jgi:hypothetical protein
MREIYTVRVSKNFLPPQIGEITIAMLHRKGKFSIEFSLEKLVPYRLFECIYVIEESEVEGSLEYLIKTYPWVKFLVYSGAPTPGMKINAASRELTTNYFCLFWDDMEISSGMDPQLLKWLDLHKPVCAAPILYSSDELIPSINVPAFDNSEFITLSFLPFKDMTKNFFPTDFCGIYHRVSFQRLRGFNEDFTMPYWQLADFGVRNWLSDNRILSCNGFSCRYDSAPPNIDITAGKEYELFQKRNASFRFNSHDKFVFKKSFAFRKLLSRIEKSEIKELHHWAKKDLFTIIENWEPPVEESH